MKRKICITLGFMLALSSCAIAEHTPAPSAEVISPDLLEVDHRLYQLGYRDSSVTGKLSETMVNALRNFQIVNQLEITGAPDDDTIALLMSGQAISQKDYLAALSKEYEEVAILENGAHGSAVRRLQQQLKELGYFSGDCDGAYGRATEEAVYRFQMANGLEETGIADGMVILRLYEGTPLPWDKFLQENCASVGETGTHVRRIQLWLKNKNHFSGACTGRYGEGTQQAVKRFQTEYGLEATGDVDLATCRALFSNVSGMLADADAIRNGEFSAEAQSFCRALVNLGYPAREEFGMQTELAVMEFQYINGLEITGEADRAMQALLKNAGVKTFSDFTVPEDVLILNTPGQLQIARQAISLLGAHGDFYEPFDFVRFVYLRCGHPLMAPQQLELTDIEEIRDVQGGQVLYVETPDGEFCGIGTSDGAIVYVDDSGYVVMRYLEMMDVRRMRGCMVEALE